MISGKSSTNKDDEKKDDNEIWPNVEVPNAFLGPNLWDKTLPYDTDLKVQEVSNQHRHLYTVFSFFVIVILH